MAEDRNTINNFKKLLRSLSELANEKQCISFDEVLEKIGRRSYGPILLLLGIMMSVPVIGGIPGMPIIISLLLLTVSIQLLLKRSYFWFPSWFLKRSIRQEKLKKAVSYLEKPAIYIDKVLKPRLDFLVCGLGLQTIAVICVMVSVFSPMLELIPFSANVMGAILVGFGLALITYDGLMVCISMLIFLGVIFLN